MSAQEMAKNAVFAQQNTATQAARAATNDATAHVLNAVSTTPVQISSHTDTLHSQGKHGKRKAHHHNPSIPSNCIVLKNLDYSITQVTLEEVVCRVTGGCTGSVNISLVDDRTTGSFKGIAFANFHSIQDATNALGELSKMIINGRKVVAEYRRMRTGEKYEKRGKQNEYNYSGQTFEKNALINLDGRGAGDKRAAFFARRESSRIKNERNRDGQSERDLEREAEFRNLLIEFGQGGLEDDCMTKDLVFDASLTSYERRMVHTICSELGLGHLSHADESGNRVLHVTKDAERALQWENDALEAKTEAHRQLQVQQPNKMGSKEKKMERPSASDKKLLGITWFKPRSASITEGTLTGTIRAPSYKVYVPARQPIGPDGTAGFGSRVGVRGNGGKGNNADVIMMDVEGVDQGEKGGTRGRSALNPSVPPFSPQAPKY